MLIAENLFHRDESVTILAPVFIVLTELYIPPVVSRLFLNSKSLSSMLFFFFIFFFSCCEYLCLANVEEHLRVGWGPELPFVPEMVHL